MGKKLEDYLAKAKLYEPTGIPVLDRATKRLLEAEKALGEEEAFTEGELALLLNQAVNYSTTKKKNSSSGRKIEKALSYEVEFMIKFRNSVFEDFAKKFVKADTRFLSKLIHNQDALQRPLRFRGPCNVLVEFFKRTKYNKLLSCRSNAPLAEWICRYFLYEKDSEFKPFNPKTVLDILKNTAKEGEIESHILTNKVPYIPIKDRKNKKGF